ncbi:Hsp20/alpha crystallin family protein [Dissulfurirhabdus thermomarina]|uniref:Hsp20/alpha crystallin family protein n=1 Tax=Dissulfurirhabdus thermomarina TaxID=1765737 RepID=A0A6N9TPL7_DISTH|nr:Hsp20/alpha crystallin family protein [Dissulfurirhabdus thermomarina]NDY42043.1 Hsp20/alpha crystallin family protein [Dissulfurirhabdus thermomarina]NMX22335.1 Hsp20/alpha crystallin family protein [Dissulfurirhabdus thermomarina]
MLGTWLETPVWNDFARLQRELERLFDLAAPRGDIRGVVRGTFPAVNVVETQDNVLVYVFAPGIPPGEVEISLNKNLLTVAAERKTDLAGAPAEGEPQAQGYHRRERFHGRFRRIISLPEQIDPDKVEAVARDGIIQVTIGKREEAKPRKIEVKV